MPIPKGEWITITIIGKNAPYRIGIEPERLLSGRELAQLRQQAMLMFILTGARYIVLQR